jgi:two-component system, NarL family, invasion response regulator UvrY
MRVFLVDAHPLFREGLKKLVSASSDLTVIGEADTCRDLFDHVCRDCDLVVLDGESDSLALLQSLEKARPKGRPPFSLVLTRYDDEQHAIQLLAAGADGYLQKTNSTQFILDAIRKVSRGAKCVSRELAESLLFNLDRMKKPARLSDREYQVLYLFASGLCIKEIAGQLSLSVKTVSTYRGRLLEKLNLRSNAQLMRYAFKEGVMTE